MSLEKSSPTGTAKEKAAENTDWIDSPNGQLVQLSQRLKSAENAVTRRRWLATLSVGAISTALGVRVWQYAASRDQLPLACIKVQAMLPNYLAKKLDQKNRDKVADHLAYCPRCNKFLRDLTQRDGQPT